jgi:hypothetical protein
MRQIKSMNLVNPTQISAVLNSPFPTPIFPWDPVLNKPIPILNYYIVRAARPVGDEILKMPVDDAGPDTLSGVIIDLNTNISGNFTNAATGLPWNYIPINAGTTQFVDILFTSAGIGQVFVGSNGISTPCSVPTGILNLWVRSVDVPRAGDPAVPAIYFQGDPTLVSIHLSNGFVGAYSPDVNLPGANPYFYVQ